MQQHYNSYTYGPIKNLVTLAKTLGISLTDLVSASNSLPDERFTKDDSLAVKKDGSPRIVYKPSKKIRIIQNRINTRIFSGVIWASYLYGSIPKRKNDSRDYVAAANVHCECKSILSVDIKDFFDNIHIDIVREIFRNTFQFSDDVSSLLAELCCYEDRLVQGALTSSYLANLCLNDVEPKIYRRLSQKGLKYTRLIDDINISSHIQNYDFTWALQIVRDALSAKDLPLNEEKTKIQRLSTIPIMVHGLRVHLNSPRLTTLEIKQIKAAVHDLSSRAAINEFRTGFSYRTAFNRVMGRVNKLARVKHKDHKKLVKKLKDIRPLPGDKDVINTSKLLLKVELDLIEKRFTYLTQKRLNLAKQRINLLARSEHYSDAWSTFKNKTANLEEWISEIEKTR